jgi:enamine deaminase RidA (YjgF/YER057c/UK114 family)
MTQPSLPPLRIPFADLWGMRIEHPYSLLVREGGFAWTCGQCPLSAEGAVLAPDDLAAQAEPVDGYIRHLLDKAGYSPANVGKLVAYYAVDEPAATERMLSHFREAYPGAVLMPVATPFFYYPGMRLEVDVHAAERRAPLVTARDDANGLRLQAVDAGDLVWVSLEIRAMRSVVADETARALDTDAVRDALRKGGISAGALLADHWFVVGDGARPALVALEKAGLVTDPGAAVGVSLPGGIIAMGELTFAGGGAVSAHAISAHPGITLVARSSRHHFWIAARSLSPALSLVEETKAIMAAIAETMRARGWRFEAVTKASTHYVGSSAAEDLHDNMAVRNAYYRRPGPASTGLPVAAFPFSPSKIAVDVLGVVE